jgi:hypothetical protein
MRQLLVKIFQTFAFMKNISITAFLILAVLAGTSQNYRISQDRVREFSENIDGLKFDEELFRDAVFYFLNRELAHLGYLRLEAAAHLSIAAQDYAILMAAAQEAKPDLGGSKASLQARLSPQGGSASGVTELYARANASLGRTQLRYDSVAIGFVQRWANSRSMDILSDDRKPLVGIGAAADAEGKRIYVCMAIADYSSINNGAPTIKSNPALATASSFKLQGFDEKICRAASRAKNLSLYHDDITTDSLGRIYFVSDNFRDFSRFIKDPASALAIDIISKEQYGCEADNIVDNSLPSRGYMLKPVPQKKLVNEIEGREARNKCRIYLGKMPPSASAASQINLLLIQERRVCARIEPAYRQGGQTETSIKLDILADTITAFNTFSTSYVPQPDTTMLNFKVPFQLGKSEYSEADIKPFIDALGEPDFIVNRLKITAYSSIEGEEQTNERIRELRAANIYEAFKEMNPGLSEYEVITADSWGIFKTDIKGTEFDTLAALERADALRLIRERNWEGKLEPIFKNHRFADIEMQVVYDISGAKEKKYVLKKFHDALAENNLPEALAIEKYIMHKVVRRQYPAHTAREMKINPDSSQFAGMEMNRLWLEYRIEQKPIDTAFYRKISQMALINPQNDYIRYNKAYCRVLFDTINNESQIADIQMDIDALLTSSLSKEVIDPLNLKFQLSVLSSMGESFEPADQRKLVLSVLERLKSIVQLTDADTKQAISLANLFIGMDDFAFAAQILEPFINTGAGNEAIIFAYLSVCTNLKDKHHSPYFARAVRLASDWNLNRLCQLFSQGKFSYRVLENPAVKHIYCEKCADK